MLVICRKQPGFGVVMLALVALCRRHAERRVTRERLELREDVQPVHRDLREGYLRTLRQHTRTHETAGVHRTLEHHRRGFDTTVVSMSSL